MRIYLIGFMGVGKTHWGKIWAEHLQLNFFDLDAVVEQKAGLSIDGIFKLHGESGFRELEQACLHATAEQNHVLYALGGGTPCYQNNMNWINEHGVSVWLDASPELLANRIETDHTQRPLLDGKKGEELLKQIVSMLQFRKATYQKAQIRLSADRLRVDDLSVQLNLLKP
jgi:shikimate kinase